MLRSASVAGTVEAIADLGKQVSPRSGRLWRPGHRDDIWRSFPMAWALLFAAGLCEVAWPIGLKYTQGFSKVLPIIGTVAAMAASAGLLGLALRSLPVGTGYAVWTGIGIIGTTVLGIYLFGDSAAWPRLVCIGLILCGIVGLKLTS